MTTPEYDIDITAGQESAPCAGGCGQTTQVVIDGLGQQIKTLLARDPLTGTWWCEPCFALSKAEPTVRV